MTVMRDVALWAFTVDFFEDDNSQIVINVTAVLCAAQMYYDMVMGDELG